jgi:hypothetical protein
VQYLDTGVGERGGGRRNRGVQPQRALGAAGHEERREIRVEPEGGPALGAQRGAVERRDHPPDGESGEDRMRESRCRKAGRDVPCEPGAELVRDAGERVALVDDQGKPSPARSQIRRHRHVATEPDDHVGAHPVEHGDRLAHRVAQPAGREEQVGVHTPRQRHRGHQLQRVAGCRDQRRLESARSAQAGDLQVRVAPSQRVGGGEQRGGVPRSAAAGQQHPLHDVFLTTGAAGGRPR